MSLAVSVPVILVVLLGAFGVGVVLGRRKGSGTGTERTWGWGTLRFLFAVPSVLLALFCGFGFLASFEPGQNLGIRVIYTTLGFTSAAAAGWLVARR